MTTPAARPGRRGPPGAQQAAAAHAVRPRPSPRWAMLLALGMLAACHGVGDPTGAPTDDRSGAQPGARSGGASPDPCRWEQLDAGPLRLRVQTCHHATGTWTVRHEPGLPGLALWRDGDRVQTVLQWFGKPPAAGVSAVMPELQARGLVPPGGDCVFRTLDGPSAGPPGSLRHDIRPAGARLAAFQATPRDQIPDPPCGAYGWSTHGVRYFVSDPRQPQWVLYIDLGQDGTQIDPASIRWR